MTKKIILCLFIMIIGPILGHAEPIEMKVLPDQSKVTFSIPYTFGTHHGTSTQALGSMKFDPMTFELKEAKIQIPISSLKTGNDKRDCHLREALGIDYTQSKYPKSHVCDNKNTLPDSGVDSVANADITFTADPTKLTLGKNEVKGTWLIHGSSRVVHTPITLSRDKNNAQKLIVDGSEIFKLEDFGIKVKPFSIVHVGDNAVSTFHLEFAP